MNERSGRAAIVRVLGTWFIVAGLLLGLVAAETADRGYLVVAGLLALIGVGLRIEAAVRDLDAHRRRTAGAGADHP